MLIKTALSRPVLYLSHLDGYGTPQRLGADVGEGFCREIKRMCGSTTLLTPHSDESKTARVRKDHLSRGNCIFQLNWRKECKARKAFHAGDEQLALRDAMDCVFVRRCGYG